jgi:threonine/homoserine/homoserine lactone efflux protein
VNFTNLFLISSLNPKAVFMLSNFYPTHSSISPESGGYTPHSYAMSMDTSVNLLMIILPFAIAIAIAFYRDYRRGFHQNQNEEAEIQHQREILERIWKMQTRK